MCRYCKLETIGEGERRNNLTRMIRIKDGSEVIELYLARYNTDDGMHISELVVDQAVNTDAGCCTVHDKSISIKYCPFCGEKL